MLAINIINKIFIILLSLLLFIVSIGLVFSILFNNKQSKKYKECLKLIKEKEDGLLNVKTGLEIEDIEKIDNNIDINKLMVKLYDIYLEFINKLNNNDIELISMLDEFIGEVYKNKLDIYNKKQTFEITDNIELNNYSIMDYKKNKVEFRINISCFNYKKMNEKIVSGNNLQRVEQIFIITYVKLKKKWLINNIEKVYEKNLSI